MFKKITSVAILTAGILYGAIASANVVKFSWDPVNDDRVAQYVLGIAVISGADGATYTYKQVTVPQGTVVAESPDLPVGNYWAVVKACNADLSQCSTWSNEVSFTVRDIIKAPEGFAIDSIIITLKP